MDGTRRVAGTETTGRYEGLKHSNSQSAIRNPKSKPARGEHGRTVICLFTLLAALSLFFTPALVYPANYVIGAGDVLFISVLGDRDLDTVATVNPGGKISFPLVGDVQASGLTAEELAGKIARPLSQKVRNPTVSVALREIHSYRVYVLGGVARPGVLTSKSEITVLQALALAGGVAPGADLSLAYVARGDERLDVDFRKLVMEGDLSHNLVLKPEDVIVISSNPRNAVFIMGEVRSPGSFPLDRDGDVTILKALAQAGGFGQFARPSRTIIIRQDATGRQVIRVNVDNIMKDPRKAEDIRLQPGDVVVVPKGGLF